MKRISHISLFSGIGGFDLAAKWMGWENLVQVEKDEYCLRVLAHHYPNAVRIKDIRAFNQKNYAADVVSAGFPCQPFSLAGNRKGEEDDRYLWAETLTAIRRVQPLAFVLENVVGIVSLCLEQILNDLEREGFRTQTFLVPAAGVGAIHKRERVWIIGFRNSVSVPSDSIITGMEGDKSFPFQRFSQVQRYTDCRTIEALRRRTTIPEPLVRAGAYGVSFQLFRNQLSAIGNSIVPQIALILFFYLEKILLR